MPLGGEPEYDERLDDCQDLPALVLKNTRQFGDKTFLIDGLLGRSASFQYVHDEAVQIASALRHRGFKDGSIVAVFTDTTIEAYCFVIGVWLAGGCVAAVNFNLTTDEIAQLIELSTAEVIFCQTGRIADLEKAISILGKSLTIITDGDVNEYTSVDKLKLEKPLTGEEIRGFKTNPYDPHEHITTIMFTSGTTGASKGVMLSSYATLINGCRVFNGSGAILVTTPLYWISNPSALVNALISNCTIIFPRVKLIPGTNRPDLHHLLSCIQQYKPEKWMSSPSTAMDICLLDGSDQYDLSSLKHLSIGGSLITPSQKKLICNTLFKRNIIQERYGTTEVGFITRMWSSPPPDFDDPKCSSFGRPSPGIELKYVNMETGQEVGPHQVGELFCRSDCIMKGYINKELPQRYTKDDWYDVGDTGYYDEDGWCYFSSRTKELIKYRGNHIAPADLEKVIIDHPDVLDACVVGVPHSVEGEHPLAFVVKKSGSPLSEADLMSFVNTRVSDDKRLRGGVVFKSELPKSAIGKVLRRVLTQEASSIGSNG